jgi:hypothetical protein
LQQEVARRSQLQSLAKQLAPSSTTTQRHSHKLPGPRACGQPLHRDRTSPAASGRHRRSQCAGRTNADVVVWNPQRLQSLSARAAPMNIDHSP